MKHAYLFIYVFIFLQAYSSLYPMTNVSSVTLVTSLGSREVLAYSSFTFLWEEECMGYF